MVSGQPIDARLWVAYRGYVHAGTTGGLIQSVNELGDRDFHPAAWRHAGVVVASWPSRVRLLAQHARDSMAGSLDCTSHFSKYGLP